MIILALTFIINILVLIYYGFLLRMRLAVDTCEPLLTFVIGYSSPRGQLFDGSALRGFDSADYAIMFVVEERNGELAVVAIETASDIELMEEDPPRRQLRS
jgi:hypothetical protein